MGYLSDTKDFVLRKGREVADATVDAVKGLRSNTTLVDANPNVPKGGMSSEARAYLESQRSNPVPQAPKAANGLRSAASKVGKFGRAAGPLGVAATLFPHAMDAGGAAVESMFGGMADEYANSNESLIPKDEQDRLIAKYGPKKPESAKTGLREASPASPIDNSKVPVPPGTGVVRTNSTGAEYAIDAREPNKRVGLREPDGIFGFMAGAGALAAQARSEVNDQAKADNATRLGLRQQTNQIAAAKVVQDQQRLAHDIGKDARDAGMRKAEALQKDMDRLFVTTDADGKQIDDKASRADFERKAQFTLGQMALDEEKRTGKPAAVRNLQDLNREELQQLFTMFQASKNVKSQRGGLPDYFGTSQVDSDDLRAYLPQDVKSGFFGDTITLGSGEKVDPEDYRGGGFRLLGPNTPVNADILRLEQNVRDKNR